MRPKIQNALVWMWPFLTLLWGATHAIGADAATARAAAERASQRWMEATVLAQRGGVAAAEAALEEVALSRAGTVQWRLEMAQNLFMMADSVVPLGKAREVRLLAQRALAHLREVERASSDNKSKAAAFALAGQINERFLGDVQEAISSYRAATQHNSADKLSADKLRRLELAQKRRKG